MIAFSRALATLGVWGAVAMAVHSVGEGGIFLGFLAVIATAFIWIF